MPRTPLREDDTGNMQLHSQGCVSDLRSSYADRHRVRMISKACIENYRLGTKSIILSAETLRVRHDDESGSCMRDSAHGKRLFRGVRAVSRLELVSILAT